MSRSRILKAIALVLVMVPTVFVAGQPAHSVDAGGVAFEGTASLPKFPCALPTTCPATFTGTASGQLAGEQFGPWEATIAAASVSTTNLVYSDTNCVTGTASGRATVTAGLGQVTGEYKPNNTVVLPTPSNLLPLPIEGLTIDADFTWNRFGGTAAVVFANGVVRATVAGQVSPMVVMSGAFGGSTAAFQAHIEADDPPDCNPTNIPPTNTPEITADVFGVVTLADDTVA